MDTKKKRLVGIIIIVLSIVGIIYLGLRTDSFEKNDSNKQEDNNIGKEIDNGNKDDNGDNGSEDEIQEARGDVTFLLLGVDDGSRTDTIMVCKYFEESGQVSILSIPRDSRVEIAGRGPERINHAHVYGGPELALETINSFLDMKIEDYIRVDFNMVEEVVDILGGVEVEVPEGIYWLEPGLQILDGGDALEVIRHRASYSDQDLGRIDFQQRFLISLIDQIVSSRKLSDLASMVRSGRANIDTNLSTVRTIRYIMKLRNVRTDKVRTETLSGEHAMVDGLFYILVDQAEARSIARELFKGN